MSQTGNVDISAFQKNTALRLNKMAGKNVSFSVEKMDVINDPRPLFHGVKSIRLRLFEDDRKA